MDRHWKRTIAAGVALAGGIVGGLWDVSAEAAPSERRLVLRPSANETGRDVGREATGETLLSKWISRSAAANAPASESASERGGRLRLMARKPKPESTEPVVSADADEIVIPGLDEVGDGQPSATSSSRSRGRR